MKTILDMLRFFHTFSLDDIYKTLSDKEWVKLSEFKLNRS